MYSPPSNRVGGMQSAVMRGSLLHSCISCNCNTRSSDAWVATEWETRLELIIVRQPFAGCASLTLASCSLLSALCSSLCRFDTQHAELQSAAINLSQWDISPDTLCCHKSAICVHFVRLAKILGLGLLPGLVGTTLPHFTPSLDTRGTVVSLLATHCGAKRAYVVDKNRNSAKIFINF